jgi:uncharacterized protein (DUF2267 family)
MAEQADGGLSWDDKYRTYRLLRATLYALSDRHPAHEAVHLGAQLPMLIRGRQLAHDRPDTS